MTVEQPQAGATVETAQAAGEGSLAAPRDSDKAGEDASQQPLGLNTDTNPFRSLGASLSCASPFLLIGMMCLQKHRSFPQWANARWSNIA